MQPVRLVDQIGLDEPLERPALRAGQPGDQVGQVQQRRSEDHRDDAGLVHLERQVGRRAAVHAPPDHALGVLHRDAALALLDEHDAGDDGQAEHADAGEDQPAGVLPGCCAPSAGIRAAIEEKISSDMPLPMPRSVTCSPSHMMTAVPAVIVMTMIESVKMLESGMTGWVQLPNSCPRSASATMPGGLQDRQRDRQVAGVLGQLVLTRLPFLLQLLEPRDDHGEQLDDDAGGDVGHDAQREDRQLQQRTAGEQVDQRVDAGVLAALDLPDALLHVRVRHPGRRDRGARAVDRDHREGEEDLLPEVRRGQGRPESAEHGHPPVLTPGRNPARRAAARQGRRPANRATDGRRTRAGSDSNSGSGGRYATDRRSDECRSGPWSTGTTAR